MYRFIFIILFDVELREGNSIRRWNEDEFVLSIRLYTYRLYGLTKINISFTLLHFGCTVITF